MTAFIAGTGEFYELRVKLDQRLITSVPESVPYEAVAASAEEKRAQLAKLKEISAARPHPLGDHPVVVLTRGLDTGPGLREVHAALARFSPTLATLWSLAPVMRFTSSSPAPYSQAIRDFLQAQRSKKQLPAR